MTTSRRGLLVGAAGLAGIAWIWQRFGVKDVKLAFEPIPGLHGWQRGLAGAISGSTGNATNAVFVGIGTDHVDPLPANRLCDTLYRADGPGTQIAVFTDFFCPNCRVMDPMLASRNDLAITWHELPLLGPQSEAMGRALLAADLQGGYGALKTEVLKASFRPGPQPIMDAARAAGLDTTRLLTEMDGPAVVRRMADTRATARTLGIPGTPAVVIGKTLVIGRLARSELDEVLSLPLGTCDP